MPNTAAANNPLVACVDMLSELVDHYYLHVPHVLLRHMLNQVVEEFLSKRNSAVVGPPPLLPSMERYHGVLLFIDISGFTLLSSRLNVDDLRLHINAYFERILRIIDSHGGQVIKFAGDALFVFWQIPQSKIGDDVDAVNKAIQGELTRAISCGLEINSKCSKYKITFGSTGISSQSTESPLKSAMLHPTSPDGAAPSPSRGFPKPSRTLKILIPASLPTAKSTDKTDEEDEDKVAYLDVHSGLSVGTIAGMDIGAEDRWEFLLYGKALSEVAEAESTASKGELAISAIAHAYYHPNTSPQTNEPEPGAVLSCGCTCLSHGCYSVSSSAFGFTDVQMMLKDLQSANAAANSNEKYRKTMLTNNSTRKIVTDILIKDINAAFETVRTTVAHSFIPELKDELDVEVAELYISPQLVSSCALQYFYLFTLHLLSNWILKHIHEAVRVDIKSFPDLHLAGLSLPTLYDANAKSSQQLLTSMAKIVSEVTMVSPQDFSSTLGCTSHDVNDSKVSTFSAELRNVIILFITLGGTSSLELNMDASSSGKDAMLKGKIGAFNFLPRTTNEYMHDTSTLQTYHGYITLLVKMLCKYNGQLRQFIIDDKGIVGIGTFGLRNAVNYDNAAQAIEVSKVIIDQFQLLYNLEVGIGITSGRNYCGLVGSPWRCEYSVMGPSTNLAARLMVRANNIPVEQVLQSIETNAAGNSIAVSEYEKDNINVSVLCDESIQTRDRTHDFAHLGTIQAKGYVLPVHIYAPLRNAASSAFKLHSVAEEEEGKQSDNNKVGELVSKSKSTSNTPRAHASRKQRKQSLLKSSFYADIHSALQESFLQNMHKGNKSLTVSKKSNVESLYGRNAELQRVLKYLFYYLFEQRAAFSVDSHDGKEAVMPDVFTTSFKCLVINVAGPHGIGKTAFLYEVLRLLKLVPVNGESITTWQKNMFTSIYGSMESSSSIANSAPMDVTGIKRKLNLKIVHRKLSSYTSTEPFFAWKSLFRKLMYYLLETKYQHLFGDSTSTSNHSEQFYTKFNQSIYDFLREKFPDEIDSFLSLLSLVGLNLMKVTTKTGEKTGTAAVSTSNVPAMILVSFAGFLCKVVQVLVNETGCVIVAAFDDAHFMDSYSWLLVRLIWAGVSGIVIICTSHTSVQAPSAGLGKAKSFSNGHADSLRSDTTSVTSMTGSSIDLYSKRKVEGNGGINFKEVFVGSPEALHVDLSTIDVVSASSVIQRLFNENSNLRSTIKIHGLDINVDDEKFSFNANISEDFYQLVYDLSGGNVLYVIELAKVAMDNAKLLLTNSFRQDKVLQEDSSLTDGSTTTVEAPVATPAAKSVLPTFDRSLLQSFPAHTRVDEVISYRFDLLDNTAQLILKVAAAICCNGHFCNYHMLCYILYYYNFHKEMEAVPKNSYFYDLMYTRKLTSQQNDVAHAYHHTNKSLLDITRSSPQSVLRLFSTTFNTVDVLKVLKHLVTSREFLHITTHKISLDFMFHHQQQDNMTGGALENIYFFPIMGSNSNTSGDQTEMSGLGLYDAYDSYDSDSDDDNHSAEDGNAVRDARLTSHIDINQLILLDNNILKHVSYDFSARLEMQNIYKLMLEEQKIELHLAIANYFNFVFNIKVHQYYSTTIPRSLSANTSSRRSAYSWLSLPCIPSSDLLEQSFHYLKGMAHNGVIVSLYYYASFLASINASSKAYEEYHNVYIKIVDQVNNYRQLGSCDFDFLEAEDDEDDEEEEDDSEQSDAASHVSRTSLGSRASRNDLQTKLFALKSPGNMKSAYEKQIYKKWFKLTKLDLYRLCNYGDSSLLEVYILTVIRLAQCFFSLYYDANMAVLLYEQAFHLILLTCREKKSVALLGRLASTSSGAPDEHFGGVPTVDSAAVEDKSVSVHQRGMKSGISTADGIEYEDYEAFGISDFSLLFPIISGMVMMYRLGYFSDDGESHTLTGYKQNKEYKVIELYSTLAQSSPNYLPYSILGDCLLHNYFLHLHTNKAAKKTRSLTAKIMDIYDLTDHNPTILQLYVFDIVPQTIAMQFVYKIWLQRSEVNDKLLNYLVFLLPKIEQYNTLAAALLPLCIGLNCLGQCRYSFELYDTTYYAKELNYEPTSTKKLSTLFSDYKQHFHHYLLLMSQYEEIQALCFHIQGEVTKQQMDDKRTSAVYISNINHMNRIEAFLSVFMQPAILQHESVVSFMESFHTISTDLIDRIIAHPADSPFMTLSQLEQKHQGQLGVEGSTAVSATRPLTHAGCDHVGASREYVVAASLYLHAVFLLLSYHYRRTREDNAQSKPSDVNAIVLTLHRALDHVRYTLHITQPSIKTYLYSFMMALMLEINILTYLLYVREHFPEAISEDSAVLYQEVRTASLHLYRKTLDGLEVTFPLLEEIYLYHV